MHALIGFIAMVISLYIWVIIIGAILSWLIAFDVVNRRNRAVYTIADSLYRLTEPALRPIRKVLPDLGGLDISPVILILGLIFLRDVVLLELADLTPLAWGEGGVEPECDRCLPMIADIAPHSVSLPKGERTLKLPS